MSAQDQAHQKLFLFLHSTLQLSGDEVRRQIEPLVSNFVRGDSIDDDDDDHEQPRLAEVEDEYGCTALHLACFLGANIAVTELLRLGADINAKVNANKSSLPPNSMFNPPRFEGCTPLGIAVVCKHSKITSILLNHGTAELTAPSKFEGKTIGLLAYAVEHNDHKTVQHVLDYVQLRLAHTFRNPCLLLLALTEPSFAANHELSLKQMLTQLNPPGSSTQAFDATNNRPYIAIGERARNLVVTLDLKHEPSADITDKIDLKIAQTEDTLTKLAHSWGLPALVVRNDIKPLVDGVIGSVFLDSEHNPFAGFWRWCSRTFADHTQQLFQEPPQPYSSAFGAQPQPHLQPQLQPQLQTQLQPQPQLQPFPQFQQPQPQPQHLQPQQAQQPPTTNHLQPQPQQQVYTAPQFYAQPQPQPQYQQQQQPHYPVGYYPQPQAQQYQPQFSSYPNFPQQQSYPQYQPQFHFPQQSQPQIQNQTQAIGPVSELQALCQRQNSGRLPDYESLGQEGPPHKPVFRVRVITHLRNVEAVGQGSTKKIAKAEAAQNALHTLEQFFGS